MYWNVLLACDLYQAMTKLLFEKLEQKIVFIIYSNIFLLGLRHICPGMF